jgi:uncharacterized repeat protein (TIGR01451 family)
VYGRESLSATDDGARNQREGAAIAVPNWHRANDKGCKLGSCSFTHQLKIIRVAVLMQGSRTVVCFEWTARADTQKPSTRLTIGYDFSASLLDWIMNAKLRNWVTASDLAARHRWLPEALRVLGAGIVGSIVYAAPAQAANCSIATSQGSTGPADYQSYCWIDFSSYNDTAARSGSGQSFNLALQDGTVMTFNLKVSGAAITSAASPSWTGGAVGNTAFLGISGEPILYQTAAGTTTATISNIVLTPPAGAQAATSYMIVAGDGESSNDGESLRFQTNGGGWTQLDVAGPISGSTYPTTSGAGTSTYTITGVAGTVGSYIAGSNTPTTVTTTLLSGGLQGVMFAVRFASIKLTSQITGARVNAADQFAFAIAATANGSVLASGTSTGTGLGPFVLASLSSTSGLPLTLSQAMASGSSNALSHYRSTLTCTNSAGGSSTVLPSNVVTSSYSFGSLRYGDAVTCTFNEVPQPHLTLQKVLGTTRTYASDQFTLNVNQGAATVATVTTTGTGSTVAGGATPQYQGAAGTVYTLSELGAGATSLNQYTATMACTNAFAASSTALPTAPGGTVTPQMGDVITCTITNRKIAANALLTISKTATPVSDPVNGTNNPKLTPGAIVRYTFTVSNTGPTPVDNNSVWLIDTLPGQLRVGTAAAPLFTQGSPTSGLSFTAGTDIKYSNASSPPASYAACTYTPTSAYDAAVKYICLNPKGSMAGSTGTSPSFTLSIQAQLN